MGVLEKWGAQLSRWTGRFLPEPFVLALLLTLIVLSLVVGRELALERPLTLWLEGGNGGKGFWSLLGFGMQMCLILITGHALASSPPVHRALNWIADRARSEASAIAIVAIGAMVLGLVHWGLGLIGGAVLARQVGIRCRQRAIPVHYPLLVAAGYTGLLVWHGGLSGSAPLKVTLAEDLAEILPADVASGVAPMSLLETIGSPSNLLINGLLLVLVPLILWLATPKDLSDRKAFFQRGGRSGSTPTVASKVGAERSTLEGSRSVVWLVAVPGLVATLMVIQRQGVWHLDPNAINGLFFFLGLLLHGSIRAYQEAASEAVRGCTGIILQFPLYAGIMSLLTGSGLLQDAAALLSAVGDTWLPVAGFYLAGLVNLFVPSGGGQWAVQGPLYMQAALDAGVSPSSMVMALAYGDQWTNMLQPFWALPLLAITGVSARDIMGYTGLLLLVTQLVFVLGLLLA